MKMTSLSRLIMSRACAARKGKEENVNEVDFCRSERKPEKVDAPPAGESRPNIRTNNRNSIRPLTSFQIA
jgi:hypothetical protein